MSDVATATIVVLWRRELIAASEALRDCLESMKETPPNEAKVQRDVKAAILAAHTSLHTIAKNPGAHITVFDGERSEFVPRNITVQHPAKDTPHAP